MLSHRYPEILVQTGRGEGKEEESQNEWPCSTELCKLTQKSKHNPGSNNQVGRMPKEMLHTWKICCEMAVEQHLECIRIAAFKKFSNPSAQGLGVWHVTWLLAPRTTAYLSHFFKLLLMPPRDLHSTHKTCRLEIQGLCGFTEKTDEVIWTVSYNLYPDTSRKLKDKTFHSVRQNDFIYWPLRIIYCYLKLQMLM